MQTQTTPPIRILHLEDNPYDAELIEAALIRDGMQCHIVQAKNRFEFECAMVQQTFDLVLSDYSVPDYDGFSALEFTQQKQPGVPFILLSGTLGEEQAVESLKRGASDYIIKERLTRLGNAVKRALDEVKKQRERIRSEERIREQAAMLDAAQDGILACNLDGTIRYWNHGAEEIYGYSADEVMSKGVQQLLYSAEDKNLVSLSETLTKGKWKGESKHRTKAGKTVVVESSWTLVKNNEGNPSSILIINTDVTERAALEAQYLRAQRLESIGILASGIAHDLNNVLAPILMGAQLLRMTVNDADAEESISAIEVSAQHGADLIKQILAFGRGISGERVEVSLGHLIRDVRKLIYDTFPRSIEMHIHVPQDLWMVRAVGTQVHQILMNLCVNARDAMAEGGRLEIRAENLVADENYVALRPEAKPGAYVVLTVGDTGTGIPPEVIQRMYEPFFTTKDIGKGTGLGLSTVNNIVKSHEGFIHVYSEMGKGTRFRVYFPALVAATSSDSLVQKKNLPRGNGECVLVVDDEPGVRRITTTTLERHGYEVLTSKDGVEGLATYVANQQRVALVLTDMVMPLMGGALMIRALRRINPGVKVIALSGMVETKDHADLDGILLIQKPFRTEELLVQMRRVIDNRAE